MQSITRFLRSVKLAVVLIAFLALLSIVATLVPQNRDIAFYESNYSPVSGWLIVHLGFGSVFSSVLFIAALMLFTVNLGFCTVSRLVGEIAGRRRRRFGPDLVHVGLLVLVIGGIFTATQRREGFVYMGVGDLVELPGGYRLELLSFDFYAYDDGRPKDWVSTVDVYENGELVRSGYAIEVNHPLSLGSIDVFQTAYGEEPRVVLMSADGERIPVDRNEAVGTGAAALVLANVEPNTDDADGHVAVFELWEDHERTAVVRASPGESVGGTYTVVSAAVRPVTGLKAVEDPGFVPVLIGLIICGLGLTLTYVRKVGDKEV